MADDPYSETQKGSPEGYLELCKVAITFAASAQELREWWKGNADKRAFYGLSQAQEDELTAACKAMIAVLPAESEPKPKREPVKLAPIPKSSKPKYPKKPKSRAETQRARI